MGIKKIYDILLSPIVPCIRQEDIRLLTTLILFKVYNYLDGWDDQIPEFLRHDLETYHLFQSDKVSYVSA